MDQTNLHPVLRNLLKTAASEMDDLALECSEASEHLENGQMLAALGTLSGWEDRMHHLTVVIRAVQVWHEKLQHDEAT
jgi:hypothetical protein